MREIVFAGPLQLDRRAHLLRDGRDFAHVIVGQPPAEAAARAHLMISTLLLSMPTNSAIWSSARSGAWVGAQNSIEPSFHSAVQFCGSIGAWDRYG